MSKQPTPFQSLYRLTVMLGALVVGSMAAYRYGPPPEQLASMIDTVVERIGEMRDRYNEPSPALGVIPSSSSELSAAAPSSVSAPAWPSSETASPILAGALSPASAPTPTPAGKRDVVVEPIGQSGLAYRASGSAAGPGGMIRRFDAIAESPEKAEMAVLDKMSAARTGG